VREQKLEDVLKCVVINRRVRREDAEEVGDAASGELTHFLVPVPRQVSVAHIVDESNERGTLRIRSLAVTREHSRVLLETVDELVLVQGAVERRQRRQLSADVCQVSLTSHRQPTHHKSRTGCLGQDFDAKGSTATGATCTEEVPLVLRWGYR
jgi:hypothetical protein